jgi:hypothetical protein
LQIFAKAAGALKSLIKPIWITKSQINGKMNVPWIVSTAMDLIVKLVSDIAKYVIFLFVLIFIQTNFTGVRHFAHKSSTINLFVPGVFIRKRTLRRFRYSFSLEYVTKFSHTFSYVSGSGNSKSIAEGTEFFRKFVIF